VARVKKEDIRASNKVVLTPQINSLGTVDLKLDVTLEEFSGTGNDITKTKQALTTKMSMAAGEVLVLGGLTKNRHDESIYKTPILGDIPFIGMLFRSKTKIKTESNLYIFIRPSIIKPRFEGAPDEYTQLKLDYAKYQIMKNDSYAKDKDPIQRWFFKPTNQSIKQKLADANRGILRPVDNFTYGRMQPKSVNMAEDPYFQGREAIAKAKEKREVRKTPQRQI
jgi:general secretion pathway protein D